MRKEKFFSLGSKFDIVKDILNCVLSKSLFINRRKFM